MDRHLHHIDGRWLPASSDAWLPVEDPSTGEVFAEIADGTEADTDAAVAAARTAFDTGPWPRLRPEERRDALRRMADALAAVADDSLELMIRDTGCPRRLADMLQVGAPIGHLQEFADQAHLLSSRDLGVAAAPTFGHTEVQRVPMGVCGGIVPFNFPMLLAIWKLGPALAMGNTMVLKLSPQAPLAATVLARASEEAGLPSGVLNVVHGGARVGRRLASHPEVDKITFTGSTAVGRSLLELAAPTIKDVTLELGGKSAGIVLDDADLELAARGSCFAGFMHAGQVCAATTRVLVPWARMDEFCERFAKRAAAIEVGPADDFATDVGPVISRPQLDQIERRVDEAVAAGATALVGGHRRPGPGWYYEPTILVDVDNSDPVAREEIFGPVVCVIPYEGVGDAVRLANDSPYGLAGVVWGTDLAAAREVAGRIRAGLMWINDFGVANTDAPLGGFKQSGLGRELGPEGALSFTNTRSLYTALDADVDNRPFSMVGLGWDD
jgi:acyl-CoA reductase-like NAD-dependent aldehyde dehydrogenase